MRKLYTFETQFAFHFCANALQLVGLLLFLAATLFSSQSHAQNVTYPFMDCPGNTARPITFGSVSDFNVVGFNSLDLMNSDIEGLVAAGGLDGGIPNGGNAGLELALVNYSVASKVDPGTFNGNGLVVDGDLSWTNGQIFAGNGVYTGIASLTGVGTPDGMISQMGSSPINFSTAATILTTLSNSLAARPANGTVIVSGNSLTFNYSGTDDAIIFNISATNFSTKDTYTFNISTTSSNPTVLVNVDGANVVWQNAGINLNDFDRRLVLFNFSNTTALSTSGISIEGSILAPEATYSFNNGQLNGQVFVRNMQGGGESHIVPFCGNTENLLPVELTTFTATADGSEVVLRWTTASETNNAGFSVESKQQKVSDFTALEFVEGHGTTETPQEYSYRLSALEPGTHLFRLKQIDFDGTIEYSPAVEVIIGLVDAFLLEAPYPNPSHSSTRLRFAISRSQIIRIGLYDVRGRMVQALYTGAPTEGQVQEITIDTTGLPSGMYLIRMAGSSFIQSQSLTLIK